MNERVEQLAGAFARASAETVALVEVVPDDRWSGTCEGEGWTIAAVAHHIAVGMPLETAVIQAVVHGKSIHPIFQDWALLHSGNAERSVAHAACSKSEVLDLLRANTESALVSMRALTDAQLDRSAIVPIIADRPVTAGQLIEWVLIGHIRGHLASMRAAVDDGVPAGGD